MNHNDHVRLLRGGVPANSGGVWADLGAGTGIVGGYAHRCRSDLRFVAADPAVERDGDHERCQAGPLHVDR